MNLKRTHCLRVQDDKKAGLLWNLTDKIEELKSWDRWLVNIEHFSRDGLEHPVAILSEEELRIMSHPINESLKNSLTKIEEATCCNNNLVGHLIVQKEEIEIPTNFAGVIGNLSWFNSGDSPLQLRLETVQASKSITLDPGYGFSLGKRETHIRVFLSSIATAKDLIGETVMASKPSHAIFFGCGPTLNILNVKHPAKEYSYPIPPKLLPENQSKSMKESERYILGSSLTQENETRANINCKYEEICDSLGVVVLNRRKNWLRITPSRIHKFDPGFFKKKLEGIKEWVNAAIQGAPKARFPKLLGMDIELEKPRDGEPFEMVWVKFDDDENLWNLKFMMLGVKLGRFAGFPKNLFGHEKNLYVSRDRSSWGERRASRL